MNGVHIITIPMGRMNGEYSHVLPGGRGRKCKSIMVRPSISRGRGYAVVVKKDENEDITIQPAPRTAKLARIGRFDSFPKAAAITDLPDSVMQNIFSYVTDAKSLIRCATVSKQWRRVINATYIKKPAVTDRPAKARRNPKIQAFETAKLKIFRVPKTTTDGIETTSQRKEDASFREVSIRIAMDGSDDETRQLLNYLSRLATFLTPTQAYLMAGFDLTDAFISFPFTVWQPKLSELRLLRCSLEKISATGWDLLTNSKRLKHLYIDHCPMVPPSSPLTNPQSLAQLCQGITRLELYFDGDDAALSHFDNQFLDLLADGWKTRAEIRWLKLRAPMITTDGIENMIGRYFKLRYGFSHRDSDDKKGFTKVPKLILWLCDSSVDVDDLLSRRSGKKWFREEKLHTAVRRHIKDAYSGGEDVSIWIENTKSK